MKYIITEQQYRKIYLSRRLYAIDDEIDNFFRRIVPRNFCKFGADGAIEDAIDFVVDRMYFDYFGDIDDSSEEWESVYKMIKQYVRKAHSDKIIDFYNKICSIK